jgi:hypothetical protein
VDFPCEEQPEGEAVAPACGTRGRRHAAQCGHGHDGILMFAEDRLNLTPLRRPASPAKILSI